MDRIHLHGLLAFALGLVLAACGESAGESAGASGDGGGGGLGGCTRDADCPAGLVCNAEARCVASDGLPPEEEESRIAARPAASAERLYVIAPFADAVTLIDPETLALESVPVPEEPVDLAVLPGEDAALVLSRSGRAISLLARQGGVVGLQVAPLARRFGAVALAPDGAWALLWTPEGMLPDAGAEGIVGLVDVDALRAGLEGPVADFAAGRRHTAVHFRTVADDAVDAVVVGKVEIAVFPLGAEDPAPTRIALPALFAEIATREVVAAPDGSFLLLRSLAAPELAVFDVEARTLSTLPLPAPASDLDVTADGSLAVAVLRTTSQVAWFPLPAALGDPAAVQVATVELPAIGCEEVPCLAAPGQVALAPDGSFAVLFSNAAPTESLGIFDPADGSTAIFSALEKQVHSVALSPDGTQALVFHLADPDSTAADLYERWVDQSEGYAVVDLERGIAQLKLTDSLVPREAVFATGDRYAGVTLRDDEAKRFGLDAIDLETLVTEPLQLASAPEFAGPLPASTPEQHHRIWVTQEHPAGRIGIARLDERTVRTITGFELESEVR
ncbi:hypothetical protein [Vulgatibacter sp.]|uniref:hypothetical protein n=1 Tax=Vulgatibacter sp. TaxID=1971226 RepID=UPI003565289A